MLTHSHEVAGEKIRVFGIHASLLSATQHLSPYPDARMGGSISCHGIPVEIFPAAMNYKNESRKTKNCVSVPHQFGLVSSQHFVAQLGPSGAYQPYPLHIAWSNC